MIDWTPKKLFWSIFIPGAVVPLVVVAVLLFCRAAAEGQACGSVEWKDTNKDLVALISSRSEGHWRLSTPLMGTKKVTVQTGVFASAKERIPMEPKLRFDLVSVVREREGHSKWGWDRGQSGTRRKQVWIARGSDESSYTSFCSPHCYRPELPSDTAIRECKTEDDLVSLLGPHRGIRDALVSDSETRTQYGCGLFTLGTGKTAHTLDVFAFIVRRANQTVYCIEDIEVTRGEARADEKAAALDAR